MLDLQKKKKKNTGWVPIFLRLDDIKFMLYLITKISWDELGIVIKKINKILK